jgi:integrase
MQGSIRRPRTKAGSWSYRLDLGIGTDGRRDQRQVGGFPTRKLAEAALALALTSQQRAEWVAPSKATVQEFVVGWLDAIRAELAVPAFANYRVLMSTYVIPRLGQVRLVDLTPRRVQACYAELLASGKRDGTGLSPRSVMLVHKVLHRAFEDAVRWNELPRNPLDAVKGPRVERRELRVWNAAEARRFLEFVRDDRLFALWLVALNTGMRRGELAGLRWSAVNLEEGTVAVVQQRTTANYFVVEAEPKAHSRRVIPVDAPVVAALRAHHRGQLEERLAAGPAWTDTEYIFVSEDGRPYHPDRFRIMLEKLTRAAGLPPIRLHDLRHTMATVGLEAAIHPKIIQERLGHASISMTLDTYSHVMPGLQREASERLSAMFSK